MSRAVKHTCMIMLLSAFLTPVSGFAQIVAGQPTIAGGRLIFTHWTLDDGTDEVKLDQFAVPVSGLIPLKENLEMKFFIANVSNDLNLPTNDYSLNGFGDLRVQLSQALSDDRLLLSVGGNIPSGKTKLDLNKEWPVVEYLSENYIQLPIRRLGEGPGFNVLAGGALASGNLRYGMTAMYQFYGKYTPYDGGGKYNPGDMFSLSADAQRIWGNGSLSFNAIFSTYTTDKLDGKKVFDQSNQLDLRLSGLRKTERIDFSGMMQYVIRGRNTRYDSSEVIYDQLKIYGNEFGAYGAVTFIASPSLSVSPSVEMHFISGNEYDFGKSNFFGFGGDFTYRFSEALDALVGIRYFTGNANDSAIDLSGYQFSAGFTAGF